MAWPRLLLLLVAIQAISRPRAAADDFLSPLLSPVLDGLCNMVWCGKGTCDVSTNHTFGFVCNCQNGWSQLHIKDHLRFLPCIIPNCSVNYSCNKESVPPPAPAPPPSNLPPFDPCLWAYCGGGSCLKTSTFQHRCECKEGYSNLFNVTHFPCYKECAIGADCEDLGITLSNSTATRSSSPDLSGNSSSPSSAFSSQKNLMWLLILTILLTLPRVT